MDVLLALAFAGGVLSFLSPCIVPMVSVYLTLITGTTLDELKGTQGHLKRRAVLLNTLLFVLGFTVVFTLAGAAASQMGSLFEQARRPLEVGGGVLIVVLGLSMTGLFQLRVLERLHIPASRMRRPRGPLGSFGVGLFFSIACSHCIAPTLLAVLALAGSTRSAATGALTMLVFSLGLALPYMITAVAVGPALERLSKWKGATTFVRPATGVLVAGFGVVILVGRLPFLTELSARILPFKVPLGM